MADERDFERRPYKRRDQTPEAQYARWLKVRREAGTATAYSHVKEVPPWLAEKLRLAGVSDLRIYQRQPSVKARQRKAYRERHREDYNESQARLMRKRRDRSRTKQVQEGHGSKLVDLRNLGGTDYPKWEHVGHVKEE
jgi:hypothetical protein